jgi:hypothetical protein
MAYAQKPDFVFPRNGRVHLNRWWASVQSTAGSRGVRISLSNAGYTTFRGGGWVLTTHSIRQFPLHFPTRASPCATRFRTSFTTPLKVIAQNSEFSCLSQCALIYRQFVLYQSQSCSITGWMQARSADRIRLFLPCFHVCSLQAVSRD